MKFAPGPIRLSLAAVFSSILSFLAQSNELYLYGNAWVGLVSLVPLFWAMRRSPSIGWSRFILALHLGAASPLKFYWLASFQDYSLWTISSVTIGFLLYGIVFGPLLTKALREPGARSVFLGGMVWALYEFLRSNGFFGFPWGNLPYPFIGWDLFVQGTDWGGLPWLTFLLASGMILLEHVATREKSDRETLARVALSWSLILVVYLGYSAWTTQVQMINNGSFKVLLIQQNADPWVRDQDIPGLETSVRLSQEGLTTHPDTDLVIWSENSIRRPLQIPWFYEENPQPKALFPTIRASGTHWLFGNPWIVDDAGTRVMNAAVLVGPDATILGVYGKSHLVPVAEVIPFFEFPIVQDFFRSALNLRATWVPNDTIEPLYFTTRDGRNITIAATICFEDAFPYLNRTMAAKGAEVLIVLSNDSWSKTYSAQIQHQIVAMFRSIETRLPMIRSTNSGYTAVNDPRGRIVAGPLPFFEAASLSAVVELERFPYTPLTMLLGDWTGWLAWWFTLAFLILRGGILKQSKYSYFAERLRLFSSSAYGRSGVR